MALSARVREKGQLTVPAAIRREAGIEEGSVVEFEIVEDGVLLRPRSIADTGLDLAFVREVIAQTTAGYAAMRDDPEAWAEELRERELWESTLPDGLDE